MQAQAQKKINHGRLKSFGVFAPEFVPFLLPKKYLDLRPERIVSRFVNLADQQKIVVLGTLQQIEVKRDSIPSRVNIKLQGESGHSIAATFFGDPRDVLPRLEPRRGLNVCISGTVGFWNESPQIKNPEIIDLDLLGQVVPIYQGKPKVISPTMVYQHMQELLPMMLPAAAQWLRDKLKWLSATENQRLSLMPELAADPSFENLLQTIHYPSSPKAGVLAGRLLKLIATFEVLNGARTESYRTSNQKSSIKLPIQIMDKLLSETDLKPTDEQRAVIQEICADIASNHPMFRLLSADVGFGKTYVAAATGAGVVRCGGTVIWLCPNQLLAVQACENIAGWWPDVNPSLVIGNADDTPDSKFLIGTTALIHRLPKGFYPDLLIIDESQKFGTNQIDALAGPATNVLNATATCIPRTAALLEYGGMAVSRLTKAHVEKTIKTRMVELQHREKLWKFISRNVLVGHQALIIYPLAETNEEQAKDRKSAEGAYQLWNKSFPGRVRYLHGKMKDEEKLSAIAAMRNDEADILISTIAVETGIDLPRLRHVTIIHPERLGLNTLHQIRGRVARKGGLGQCDLYMPSPISPESQKRLEILVRYSDGFDVANENMNLQGFGDLGTDGTAQSGKAISIVFSLVTS
jgi:ATP-dependent DNA helicase RecG